MALFSWRMIGILSGLGPNPGLLAALMSQMVGENPACPVKNVSGQTVVAVRRMFFMSLLKKPRQENAILLVAVNLTLTATPLVIAGTVDVHDSAEKVYRILHSEFFDDFVVFPLPVTYSLFAPAPSTQYPFFNRAISTSCFATISRSLSSSLNDLLVCNAEYGFPLCGSRASSPSSRYFFTHVETSPLLMSYSLAISLVALCSSKCCRIIFSFSSLLHFRCGTPFLPIVSPLPFSYSTTKNESRHFFSVYFHLTRCTV